MAVLTCSGRLVVRWPVCWLRCDGTIGFVISAISSGSLLSQCCMCAVRLCQVLCQFGLNRSVRAASLRIRVARRVAGS